METHENIKLLREKLGMSQEILAEKTGYKDRSSIAKIEAGLVDLTQSKIAAFSAALNVTPAQLMGISTSAGTNLQPTQHGEHKSNILRIAGRDGSYIEKRLTDDQMSALKAIVDQLPEADDL